MKKIALSACCLMAVLSPTASHAQLDSCQPTAVKSCAFPYPNNYYWMKNDVIVVPSKTIRREVSARFNQKYNRITKQWERIHPANPFALYKMMLKADGRSSRGFSAGTPVIFRFPKGTFNASDFGSHGDGLTPVRAYWMNGNYQQPVFLRTKLDHSSSGSDDNYDYLQITPRSRWPHSKKLTVTVGTPNQANFQSTEFTVRPQYESVEPMKKLIDKVEVDVRLTTSVKMPSIAAVSKVQNGVITMPNYRNASGMVDYTERSVSNVDVPFSITIPKAAKKKRVPVSIYIHGLSGDKNMAYADVVGVNARNGIATIIFDLPNHGQRARKEGGGVLRNLSANKLGRTVGMLNQSVLDIAAVHKALDSAELKQVNAVKRCFLNWCDSTPDLDTSRVFIEGTSLGGIVGSAYGSLGDGLLGGVFQVSGNGIMRTLTNSILWAGTENTPKFAKQFLPTFDRLLPKNATAGESILLRSMAQHSLDYADSINYVERFKAPSDGGPARPLLLTMGAADAVVPNESTLGMAEILRLPVVGEKLVDTALPSMSNYSDGYGLRQYTSIIDPMGVLTKLLYGENTYLFNMTAHAAVFKPIAKWQRAQFIKKEILAQDD